MVWGPLWLHKTHVKSSGHSSDVCVCVCVCVCVFMGFLVPISSWCPTVQCNSDTIYLEIASDSTGQGFSPTRLPTPNPALDANPGCHLDF